MRGWGWAAGSGIATRMVMDPATGTRRALLGAVRAILRPLVRQLIAHGVTYPAFKDGFGQAVDAEAFDPLTLALSLRERESRNFAEGVADESLSRRERAG